jgi:molybdopterin converting factor small subunit
MRVTIRLRGPIAARVKNPVYSVETRGGRTLRELLQTLLNDHSEVRELWDDPESVDRDALILLNEVDIGLTGGLESLPKDGDRIIVLPLVHGG